MKTIRKFPLNALHASSVLQLTWGAQVLHVGAFFSAFYLWVLLDPNEKPEEREFVILGENAAITEPHNLRYVGSAPSVGGSVMLHVFERDPRFCGPTPRPSTVAPRGEAAP